MSECGSSSLAITEKRHSRPGGCVGIFFQLFDWNRRFAKKKLFSKKLLPPAHGKQSSKKFGADDKLPKLRLVSGENSGGFPNVKRNGSKNLDSEHKNEMRTPSLVARLMGLDSLPSAQRDKLKKASCSEIGVDRVGKFANDECNFSKNNEDSGKTGRKHELRPQKLQKTGDCDGRAVTRFEAEALQFKNVLLRSNKCKHHQKLPTPVKSPKSHPGRNTSRLIGAATRILEPGLQPRGRAKYPLPYSNKKQHTRADEAMAEAVKSSSQAPLTSSNFYDNVTLLSSGKPSCKNCGNLVEIMGSEAKLEEQPSIVVLSASSYVDHPCPGLDWSRPISPPCSLGPDQNINFQRSGENFTVAAQGTGDVRPRVETISDTSHLLRVGQGRWQLESQPCHYQQDSPSSGCYKHRKPWQNQVLVGRDGIPANSKFSKTPSNRTAIDRNATYKNKDFVPLLRSSNDQTCSRFPTKLDYSRYESEGKLSDKRGGPFSSVRKRSLSSTRKDDSSGTFSSTVVQQRNINVNGIAEKMGGLAFQSNPEGMESRVACLGESSKTSDCSSKDSGDIAFTFSSPRKQKNETTVETKGRRSQKDSICNHFPRTNSVLDKVSGQACFQKSLPLTGDTLGALLEQKLKELTSQGNDELAVGVVAPRRTAATILQELIAALTIEGCSHQNDVGIEGNDECESSYCGHTSELHTTFQEKTAARVRNLSDNKNNLSPLSVLESSFSTESCFSSSQDDSSVHKMPVDFMDFSYNEPRPIDPETDLLDSSTSLNVGVPDRETMAELVVHVSEMLCSIGLVDSRLKGSKLAHAEEVIINAELVFGNALQENKDGTRTFSVSRFLVGELETLASVLWTNSGCVSGFEDTKGNLLKGFLFDCVIEYLESGYGSCFKCGIKTFRNLPLCMNTEMLIRKVVEEIRSWTGLSGFFLDEIVEREMSCSLGKWTDFSIETFETGAVIDTDILQSLVDEIALDLWQSKSGCINGPC